VPGTSKTKPSSYSQINPSHPKAREIAQTRIVREVSIVDRATALAFLVTVTPVELNRPMLSMKQSQRIRRTGLAPNYSKESGVFSTPGPEHRSPLSHGIHWNIKRRII